MLCCRVCLLTSTHPSAFTSGLARMTSGADIGGATCKKSYYSKKKKKKIKQTNQRWQQVVLWTCTWRKKKKVIVCICWLCSDNGTKVRKRGHQWKVSQETEHTGISTDCLHRRRQRIPKFVHSAPVLMLYQRAHFFQFFLSSHLVLRGSYTSRLACTGKSGNAISHPNVSCITVSDSSCTGNPQQWKILNICSIWLHAICMLWSKHISHHTPLWHMFRRMELRRLSAPFLP